MAKFKITYVNSTTEEVESETYDDHDPWIDFFTRYSNGRYQVLRIRAESVERIDLVK